MPSGQTRESLVPSVLLFTPDFHHQKLLLHPLHECYIYECYQSTFWSIQKEKSCISTFIKINFFSSEKRQEKIKKIFFFYENVQKIAQQGGISSSRSILQNHCKSNCNFVYRYSVVCGGNPILENYGYVKRKIRISKIKGKTVKSQ